MQIWEIFIHRRDGHEGENQEEGTLGQGTIDETRHQGRRHDEGNGRNEHNVQATDLNGFFFIFEPTVRDNVIKVSINCLELHDWTPCVGWTGFVKIRFY